MPYFRFAAEREIFDYDEYKAKGKDPEPYLDDPVRNWGFPDPIEGGVSHSGLWSRVPRNHSSLVRLVDPDKTLYKLVAEDAQEVALKELGRKLTEEELDVVRSKIGDYIDWDEAMTFCLQQRIAGEL